MYALFPKSKGYDKRNLNPQNIVLFFLLLFIQLLSLNLTVVYAEEQMRSSSLNVEKSIDGDTERIDYVDDEGEITYAADKHYATVLKTKKENTVLEQYFDADGKPAIQSLGHYAVLREYNEKNQEYKVTYLGIDGKPIVIRSGYSIAIRTFNSKGYVEYEMYYDTEEKPVETYKLAYGCFKEYNENGRNIRITYLDQYHKPIISGQGFSIICRSFYEDDRCAGKVKEEYYFDVDNTPIRLSLGQYGISKEYDELGRVTVITYLGADGSPIITNEGYAVVKKNYNEDDSINTEQYYDLEGNPVSLAEGQYGYRIEDGAKIYLDSEGNDIYNLRNYLYSNQNSVIIICFIVVIASAFLRKKPNIVLLLFYIVFIFYMTILYRKNGHYYYILNPFWSYVQFFYNKELRWEILNNIFLFIPLGTILSRIFPQKRILLFVVGLSVIIELIQYITGTGLCEVDDLISNTIGGVIGFFIGTLLLKIIRPSILK